MRSIFKRLSILAASLATVFGIGLTNNDAQSAKAATITYTKVTSSLTDWSGDYLLVYESSSTQAYVWTGVDDVNCYTTATISSSTIEDDGTKNYVSITIAAMSGGYSIKVNGGTNAGKYIYGAKNSNKINFGNSASLNTIEYSSSSVVITSETSVMRFNSNTGNNRFRYFKAASYTAQKEVQLYKAPSAPVVATPSISINESDQVLSIGDSYTFTATTTNASDATVIWSTDTNDYGTIDSNGKFTATANGDVVITASITVDGTVYSDTVKVTVRTVTSPVISTVTVAELVEKTADDNTVVQVTGRVSNLTNTEYGNFDLLDLNDSSKSVYVYGATKDATKLVKTDSTMGYYTGKWTSGKNFNNACAEGDVITMEVIFLVYNSKKEVQGVITDVKSLDSLSYSGTPTKTTYNVGESFSAEGLTIMAKYGEDIEIDVTSEVTWSSFANGDTSATGTFGGKTVVVTGITVSVPTPVYTLTIVQDKASIYVDVDGTFTYELKDQNGNAYSGTVTSVSWTSSNTTVLDVDNDGVYLPYEAGSTKVSLSVVTTDATYTDSLDIEVTVAPTTISDTFDAASLNFTDTYSQTSGNVGSGTGALYTAQGVRKNQSMTNTQIQIRSTNSNSGIVSTTAKGIIKEITISWDSSTGNTRVLNIYGSNTPFTAPSDLYSSSATLIGSLSKSANETTFTVPSNTDYAYVGVRSNSGAIYLDSITFSYEKDADANDFIDLWNTMRTNGTNGICGYLDGSQESTALDELLEMYNDAELFSAATKAIINDAADGANNTISNTMAYIATYRGLNSGSSSYGMNSVYNLFDGKNNLAIVLLIGLSGLAAVAAYYFINKKKYC